MFSAYVMRLEITLQINGEVIDSLFSDYDEYDLSELL